MEKLFIERVAFEDDYRIERFVRVRRNMNNVNPVDYVEIVVKAGEDEAQEKKTKVKKKEKRNLIYTKE